MFTPSKYQKIISICRKKTTKNMVVDAVAGSGKSTTIVNLLDEIPSILSVLFLAFNKSIVEELKIKIGNKPNVDIRTLHSLGASVIMRTYHSKIQDDKYRTHINDGVKNKFIAPMTDLPFDELQTWKQNIIKLVDLGRVNLCKTAKELDDLAFKHGILLINGESYQALKIIAWGEQETSIIDFTDMIYLPNVKKLQMPLFDWVFIDECQDLNAAQREMFLKCVKPVTGRFIAVGDPRQAIYGFAGADVESFNLLKSLPNTVKLPLSVCYRCDENIINLAKTLVPQIEVRSGAAAGEINYSAKVADVMDGDMILCRITAPLVKLCMQYISNGTKAYVKGRDIGVNLINMINKTKKAKIRDVLNVMSKELERIAIKVASKQNSTLEEARETDMYKGYQDKMNAIEVLSEGLENSDEVISRIETIFKDDNKNGICLSTIHKSKGLESNRVFVLCPETLYIKWAMKIPWQAQQEKNLEYVLITRAKHYLGYITDFKY